MSVFTLRTVVSASPLAACAAFLMGVGAVGCSSLDADGDTCEDFASLSPTCEPRGNGGSAGTTTAPLMPVEWRCLDQDEPQIMQPPATQGMPPRVTYLSPFVDFDSPSPLSPTPVPGLQITVCTSPACNPPAACWPDPATSCDPDIAPGTTVVPPANPSVFIAQPNAMGAPFLFAINMPWGVDAVTIRGRAQGYAPTEYYVGGPMVGPPEGGSTVIGLPFFLLKEVSVNTLYSQLGLPVPFDKSRGILGVRTLNCMRPASRLDPMGQILEGGRGEGVRLEMIPREPDPPAEAWVLSFARQARGKRTDDEVLFTDDRGTAGFANLEPRLYTVQGVAPAPEGSEREYGRYDVTVRAGVITIVEIRDGLNVWGQ